MHRCRCTSLALLRDAEADEYTDHLVQESVDRRGHATYQCPFTMVRWIGEFIEEPNGATFRLRRAERSVDGPG
jgi:hypothetical protein